MLSVAGAHRGMGVPIDSVLNSIKTSLDSVLVWSVGPDTDFKTWEDNQASW